MREKYLIALANLTNGSMLGYGVTEQSIEWKNDIEKYVNSLTEPRGTYECFHCGQRTVAWNSDFSFEDCGVVMDDCEDGIVHFCTCSNCGAEIEYRVPIYNDNK